MRPCTQPSACTTQHTPIDMPQSTALAHASACSGARAQLASCICRCAPAPQHSVHALPMVIRTASTPCFIQPKGGLLANPCLPTPMRTRAAVPARRLGTPDVAARTQVLRAADAPNISLRVQSHQTGRDLERRCEESIRRGVQGNAWGPQAAGNPTEQRPSQGPQDRRVQDTPAPSPTH